jgi:hypothetical protein
MVRSSISSLFTGTPKNRLKQASACFQIGPSTEPPDCLKGYGSGPSRCTANFHQPTGYAGEFPADQACGQQPQCRAEQQIRLRTKVVQWIEPSER